MSRHARCASSALRATPVAVEARTNVDDTDGNTCLTRRRDERLVVAKPVLDRQQDAVTRDDVLRDLSRPWGAGRLDADDRGVDRLLVGTERRAGAVDGHELNAIGQSAIDDMADRAHPDDRHAQRARLRDVAQTAFGRVAFCRSAASSLSFIVKLCSASGKSPSRTSLSNARRASTTAVPISP